MAKKEPEEGVYMEQRALAFLRAWPDVELSLRPVYSRFLDVGLIWVDPNADAGDDWPGGLRLTERGEILKEIVDDQSFNFFLPSVVATLFPNGDLPAKADRIFKDKLPAAALGVRPSGHPSTAGLLGSLGRCEDALSLLVGSLCMNRVKVWE